MFVTINNNNAFGTYHENVMVINQCNLVIREI